MRQYNKLMFIWQITMFLFLYSYVISLMLRLFIFPRFPVLLQCVVIYRKKKLYESKSGCTNKKNPHITYITIIYFLKKLERSVEPRQSCRKSFCPAGHINLLHSYDTEKLLSTLICILNCCYMHFMSLMKTSSIKIPLYATTDNKIVKNEIHEQMAQILWRYNYMNYVTITMQRLDYLRC